MKLSEESKIIGF